MTTRRALIAASAAALAGCARAGPDHAFTAVDVHPNDYPTVVAVRWLGEELARETNGRLSIRMYPGGQLGAETDTVTLARFQVLDFCRVTAAALNNTFPLTRALTLPYVFRNDDHIRRVVDGPLGATIRASFAQRGLIGLCFYDGGQRSVYNVRHPIHTPADMHGLKLRVPRSDVFIEAMHAMGANPTPIPFGEVFTGLQTHLIDGAENNWSTFQSTRQYEVARFWSETNHAYSPDALLFSKARFDTLTSSDQDLLLTKAAESVAIMRGLWDEKQTNARAAVLAAGIEANDVDVAPFAAAIEPILTRAAADAELGALLAGIRDVA